MYKNIFWLSSTIFLGIWVTMNSSFVSNIDMTTDVLLYKLNTPLLDNFFILITSIFNKEIFLVWLILLLGLLLYKRRIAYAAFLFLGVFAGQAVKAVLKDFTDKTRPGNPFDIDIHGSSFPSGHALTAVFVGMFLIALLAPLVPRIYRLPVQIIGTLMIVLVPISRTWLHVHYLSDIIAGTALGVASFAATKVLFTYLINILHKVKPYKLPPLLRHIDKA